VLHLTIDFSNKNIKIAMKIKGGVGISPENKMYWRGSSLVIGYNIKQNKNIL
jgi:hypothetical protein